MKNPKDVKKQVKLYEKEILKQVGVFIYNQRKKRGVTIKDLNLMTGVGTAVISDLENTKSMPRIETLLRICEVLDISLSDLFDHMKLGTVKTDSNSTLVTDNPMNKYDKLSSFVAGLDYTKEEAWKKFQESGKVEDYLKYKEAEKKD